MSQLETSETEQHPGHALGEDDDLAVEVSGVSKSFGHMTALSNVTVKVPRRGRLGLLGPSGSGKSTLLSIIAGLLSEDTGSVVVSGAADAKGRLDHVALMPQRDMLFPWRTSIQNVCLPLENRGVRRARAREVALPLFDRVGLSDFADRPVDELSGGMRQRVAFLRTLVAEKDLLLLDEPFGALDSIVRGQMQEWLLGVLRETPQTMVLVTHDVEEALYLCDRVVVLSARPGRVALTIDVPPHTGTTRTDTITAPQFVAAKAQILEALDS